MSWNAKSFGIMCQILQKLKKKSETLWRNELSIEGEPLDEKTIDSYKTLKKLRTPLDKSDLDRLIASSINQQLTWDFYFYLPPLEDPHYIPTLKIDCNYPSEKISFRLEFYKFTDKKNLKLVGFGFRFETGERPSKHDFFHAQVSNRPLPSKPLLPKCPGWIPTSIPCIPLKAECPISLIFNMLISLYGTGLYNKLFPQKLMDILKSPLEPIASYL